MKKKLKELLVTKKFQNIVANPPYNENSIQETNNLHRRSAQLHVRFMAHCAGVLSKNPQKFPTNMRVICPANRWWIHNHGQTGDAKFLKENGLYAAEKVAGNPFNAAVTNIGIFKFKIGVPANKIKDDFELKVGLPNTSILDIFEFVPRCAGYEQLNFEKENKKKFLAAGKHRFWATVTRSNYFSNSPFEINDNTRGYWRIVVNTVYNDPAAGLGPLEIVSPEDYCGAAISCFIIAKGNDENGKEKAEEALAYLTRKQIKEIVSQTKQSAANSIKAIRYINGDPVKHLKFQRI